MFTSRVEKGVGEYLQDREAEAQRGKARCPTTHSSLAKPQLPLWNLPGTKEVKLKRAGGSKAGTSEGMRCMEDGSETGRQQEKGAHAHEQCPDLRLAPPDGQCPDLRLAPPDGQCPDLRLAPTESAGPAGVTCPAGATAQLEGPAGEAASVREKAV